jgi:hypothetical protein
MTEQADNSREARGLSREWRCKRWNALCEDAPLTLLVAASPPRQPSPNFNCRLLCREIAKFSMIRAMPRMRTQPAGETYCVLAAAQRDDPLRIVAFHRKNLQIWRGRPASRLFHSAKMRRLMRTRNERSICTENETEPAKMDPDTAVPTLVCRSPASSPRQAPCPVARRERLSGAILAGSSSLSGKMDLLQWQHSRPQQFDACAAEHGPLECFQSVDLAFGLATAPWFGDSVPDGVDVTGQYPRELL